MKNSLQEYYWFVKIDEGYRDNSGLFEVLELFFLYFCENKPKFEESVKYIYLNAVKTHVFRFYNKSGEVISDIMFSSGSFGDVQVSKFFYDDINPFNNAIIIEGGDVDLIYDVIDSWFLKLSHI